MEKDQEFVEMVIKALVENPDKVKVERTVDEMGVLLTLSVDPSDMGKIIGKEGRTAKAVRTLLRVLGARNNSRVNLKIAEPEGGSYVPPADDAEMPAAHTTEPQTNDEPMQYNTDFSAINDDTTNASGIQNEEERPTSII